MLCCYQRTTQIIECAAGSNIGVGAADLAIGIGQRCGIERRILLRNNDAIGVIERRCGAQLYCA